MRIEKTKGAIVFSKNMSVILKVIFCFVNVVVFAYVWLCVVFFFIPLANLWFVPDEFYAAYHQASLSAQIVTRVILYGLGIVELLALLAVLGLINYGVLKLLSFREAWQTAKLIFLIQSLIGGILLIVLAFISH